MHLLRSIKDKSVLFDNSLKELKDQMTEVQYKSEQEVRTLAHQLNRVQARDQATTHITGRSTYSYINPRYDCAKKLYENNWGTILEEKYGKQMFC
jgi:hypothetical protein